MPEVLNTPSDKKRVDSPTSQSNPSGQVSAKSSARIAPIYGKGYREGVHCKNCGAKRGNVPVCSVCQIDL